MERANGYAVGVDIGGTFTDFVLLHQSSGQLYHEKVLTTPHDYSAAVEKGLESLLRAAEIDCGQVTDLIHGTTLIINALIERKGARTALLTTRGFPDVLRTRREMRYDIYDMHIVLPPPLIERSDTYEVTERVDASGDVVVPLDTKETAAIARSLASSGVESIAVCYLHSYRYREHERATEDVLRSQAPGIPVSLSHEVLAQWREYERTCATAINAYTRPITERYIGRLEERLRALGFRGRWHVLAANSGLLPPEVAAQLPVRILESGPVGGALAAAYIGARRRTHEILAFDMGGTTAKACIVQNGSPLVTTDFEVARVERLKRGSGIPVRLPVIDMTEIGAGGGSIGRVDDFGLVSVGPESAGANPGPACYALGGAQPTVTDANLLLGYLNPEYFLGGQMALDVARAKEALSSLGMPPESAAWAIRSVVSNNMAESVRIHSAERDVDYRLLDMIAYGGAGPLHAFDIARGLGIRRVIFPRGAGVFSAFGFLTTPVAFDSVVTHVVALEDLEADTVRSLYVEMERQVGALFASAHASIGHAEHRRSVDMRYVGQGHELDVELPDTYFASGATTVLREAFRQRYREAYGRIIEDAPIEAVNWRFSVSGRRPEIELAPPVAPKHGSALKGRRRVFVSSQTGFRECPVYDRYRLREGEQLRGPALIEERECTIYVGPDALAHVDQHANIVMEYG